MLLYSCPGQSYPQLPSGHAEQHSYHFLLGHSGWLLQLKLHLPTMYVQFHVLCYFRNHSQISTAEVRAALRLETTSEGCFRNTPLPHGNEHEPAQIFPLKTIQVTAMEWWSSLDYSLSLLIGGTQRKLHNLYKTIIVVHVYVCNLYAHFKSKCVK